MANNQTTNKDHNMYTTDEVMNGLTLSFDVVCKDDDGNLHRLATYASYRHAKLTADMYNAIIINRTV